MSHETRNQKIFNCHSRPVTAISLHPSATVCASAQEGPNGCVLLWRVTDTSVLSVLSADMQDGVVSVAFSSSGCKIACIGSDPCHSIHVYDLPAISAASFDVENFAREFQTHVQRVWKWESKAVAVTGIYFDTGPSELPITYGRKHLRFWDLSRKARDRKERESYQGDLYLLVGDDMGSGFQCCLVLPLPETTRKDATHHASRITHITLTGMDSGDIYLWANTHSRPSSTFSRTGGGYLTGAGGEGELRGRRRLSKIEVAHKGGVTSLCRSSQGDPSPTVTCLFTPHNPSFTGLLSGGSDGRIKLWNLNTCNECQGCGVVYADDIVPGLQVQCPRCDGRKHLLVASFNVNLVSLFGGRCAVTSISIVGSDACVGTSSR